MELGSRLLEFIQYLDTNPNKFGLSIGLRKAENIRNVISGKTKSLNAALIADIAKSYKELDIRWLLTGEGTMVSQTPPVIKPLPLDDMVQEDDSEVCNKCYAKDSQIQLLKEQLRDKDKHIQGLDRAIGKMQHSLEEVPVRKRKSAQS